MKNELAATAGDDVRLSVVIPAYNASKYIAECLTSVLAQEDAPPFEVIVVDDGSYDDTAAIVARDFPSVRLVRKPNGGPGSARNRGVAEARGEVIVFIDADDVMLPGRLAFQGGFMLENPRFGLTFGNGLSFGSQRFTNNALQYFIEDRGLTASFEFTEVINPYDRLLTDGNYILNTACAVRRDVFIACGGQPEEYIVAEDYTMNCAISRRWPIAVTRRFVSLFRRGHSCNLMASKHIYLGQFKALSNELLLYQSYVSVDSRAKAIKRGSVFANTLLRWLWIEKGRSVVLNQIKEGSPLITPYLAAKWWLVSLLPSSVGGFARLAKRNIQPLLQLIRKGSMRRIGAAQRRVSR